MEDSLVPVFMRENIWRFPVSSVTSRDNQMVSSQDKKRRHSKGGYRVWIGAGLLFLVWWTVRRAPTEIPPRQLSNPDASKDESFRGSSYFRTADTQSCYPPQSTIGAEGRSLSEVELASKIPLESARALAQGGYEKISKGSGFIPQAGPILMILSKIQWLKLSVLGSLAEMGVHHGRFTSFLFVTARASEDLVVADLFEELQDLNVDHSGLGDKRKFLEGLQTYGLKSSDLATMHTGSTTDLPFDWATKAKFAPFRLVSVDAGHTAGLAWNDIQIAFCNLQRGGIVILDDFFHGAWPGVTEGFFRYLLQRPEPLKDVPVYPFLACKSKLFLTNDRSAYEAFYHGLLEQANDLVREFAHEKSSGSLRYELNSVPYLMCRQQYDVKDIHKRWEELIM